MPPQHHQDAPNAPQNAETDLFLGQEFSPLDAVLDELTRLEREIVVMRSRMNVFSKAIDRQANQVDALRSYVAQSETFAVVSGMPQTPAPPLS